MRKNMQRCGSRNSQDLFYWIFVEMYLFVQIYHTSSGSVRWYYILGVVVGACLMSWLLQKVTIEELEDGSRVIKL